MVFAIRSRIAREGMAQAGAVVEALVGTREESLGYIVIPKCQPQSKPLMNPIVPGHAESSDITWTLPSAESKGDQGHLDQRKRYRKTLYDSLNDSLNDPWNDPFTRRRCRWDDSSPDPGCRGRSRTLFYDGKYGVDSTQTSGTRNDDDRACTVRHIPRRKCQYHAQLTP